MHRGYLLRIRQFFIVSYPKVSAAPLRRDHAEVVDCFQQQRSDPALEATYFTDVKSNNADGIFTQSGQIFAC